MSLLIWTLLLYFPYSIVFWSMVTLENYTVKGSAPHCHSALLDSISSRHLNKNGSRVDWILNVLCLHIIWRQYLKWYLSVQFSSPARSCPTLCNPMNRSMPGLPVHHQLPEFTQTHVDRVCDAIQPSHPLSSPLLLPPIPPSISLFQWVNSSHEVAKVLEFQLQHHSFQRTPRTDFL